MWKYVLAWIPLIFIAIPNAMLRENVFAKYLDELKAHQASSATAVLLFGLYIWVMIHIWKPESARQAVAIGLIWFGLTVAFEFLFGHYVVGHPWSRLFHDYNLFAGRVWIVVLIWLTLAPYIFFRLQK
jgi:hypothetical protein